MTTSKTFYIEITTGTVLLSVSEIWPDGDAPDSPTIEDVRRRMDSVGGLWDLAEDWFLNDKALLFVGDGPS
jgi:hypothetical protein